MVAFQVAFRVGFSNSQAAASIATQRAYLHFSAYLVEGALIPLIVSRPYPSKTHLWPRRLLTSAVIYDRPYTPRSSSSS